MQVPGSPPRPYPGETLDMSVISPRPGRTVLVCEPDLDRHVVAAAEARYTPLLRTVPPRDALAVCQRLLPQRVVWLTRHPSTAMCEQITHLRALAHPPACHVYLKPSLYHMRMVIAAGAQGCYALPETAAPGETPLWTGLVMDRPCAAVLAAALSQQQIQVGHALTQTEMYMLNVLINDGSTAQIARGLNCAENTVRAMWTALQRKTGTKSRVQLVLWALRHGVVSFWGAEKDGSHV